VDDTGQLSHLLLVTYRREKVEIPWNANQMHRR